MASLSGPFTICSFCFLLYTFLFALMEEEPTTLNCPPGGLNPGKNVIGALMKRQCHIQKRRRKSVY